MSAFASVPTSMNDARRFVISALPNVSMIFGHVFVARQRSRRPDVPRPRGASFQSSHQTGASVPSPYRSTSPPGSANRRLRSITRAAMFGLLPSHTMRPVSSWLNPSLMNARRNVPDCELPSEIAQRTMPATGFGVPASSALFVAEERVEIAGGREPDAEHERILHGVLQFVEQRRIETALQADARRVRGAGKRRALAGREGPVGARESSPRRP